MNGIHSSIKAIHPTQSRLKWYSNYRKILRLYQQKQSQIPHSKLMLEHIKNAFRDVRNSHEDQTLAIDWEWTRDTRFQHLYYGLKGKIE